MTPTLKFIKNLAWRAGVVLLKSKIKIIKVKRNEKMDILTNLDLKIEDLIVNSIKNKYPGHNIIGEERNYPKKNSPYTWTIDPVDGTKYLLAGSPLYSVSIGLWLKDKPLMGVIYWPAMKQCQWAEAGKGALADGKRLKVSSVKTVSKAIIALDMAGQSHLNIAERDTYNKRLMNISNNFFRFRAYGCGTFSLISLAQGAVDAYFDLSGKESISDIGAGIIIAQEAGAKITDLAGKISGLNARHIVISNGKIHKNLLKIIKRKI